MSVLHFGVRKAATFSEPLPNKAQLTLVTGLRTFTARPLFSSDTSGQGCCP